MAGDAILTTTCPHCGTENTAFTSIAQIPARAPNRVEGGYLWKVFFVCNKCRDGLIANVVSGRNCGPAGFPEDVSIPGRALTPRDEEVYFRVKRTYPSPPSHAAPEHVPDRIAASYIEASENLHRGKHETSQMLSRKALDLATKRLLPESTKRLFGRIEELRDSGRITAEMADWAHIVRDEGNDSVHDEDEVTAQAAAELLAFTETFLMYAFTLPGMIAKRRQPDEASEAQHST